MKALSWSIVTRNCVVCGDIVESTPQKTPVTCAQTVPPASISTMLTACSVELPGDAMIALTDAHVYSAARYMTDGERQTHGAASLET